MHTKENNWFLFSASRCTTGFPLNLKMLDIRICCGTSRGLGHVLKASCLFVNTIAEKKSYGMDGASRCSYLIWKSQSVTRGNLDDVVQSSPLIIRRRTLTPYRRKSVPRNRSNRNSWPTTLPVYSTFSRDDNDTIRYDTRYEMLF